MLFHHYSFLFLSVRVSFTFAHLFVPFHFLYYDYTYSFEFIFLLFCFCALCGLRFEFSALNISADNFSKELRFITLLFNSNFIFSTKFSSTNQLYDYRTFAWGSFSLKTIIKKNELKLNKNAAQHDNNNDNNEQIETHIVELKRFNNSMFSLIVLFLVESHCAPWIFIMVKTLWTKKLSHCQTN